MNKIKVQLEPGGYFRLLQIPIWMIGIFLVLYVGNYMDTELDKPMGWPVIICALLGVMLVFVVLIESRRVLRPFRYFSMDQEGVTIASSKEEHLKYYWEKVEKILLVYEGVRLHLIIQFQDESEVKMEFSGMWYFDTLNSTKGLKHHYSLLMKYYGDNQKFTGRMDTHSFEDLVMTYDLPVPKWALPREMS